MLRGPDDSGDRDVEPARIIWLAPLTIVSAVVAVLATRWAGLHMITPPPRFAPLFVGPSVLDTVVLVAFATLVFARVVSVPEDTQRYRRIAFVALLISFIPDFALLRNAGWPPVALLMAEHVAAWLVTVELLTRLA